MGWNISVFRAGPLKSAVLRKRSLFFVALPLCLLGCASGPRIIAPPALVDEMYYATMAAEMAKRCEKYDTSYESIDELAPMLKSKWEPKLLELGYTQEDLATGRLDTSDYNMEERARAYVDKNIGDPSVQQRVCAAADVEYKSGKEIGAYLIPS